MEKVLFRKSKKLIILLLPLFLFTSCASFNSMESSYESDSSDKMFASSTPKDVKEATPKKVLPVIPMPGVHSKVFKEKVMLLASELTSNIKGYNPELKTAVVSTFVNLDDFGDTSRFGRFATESLIYEMHRSGYHVYEMRQSKDIKFLNRKGELNLTRKGIELLDKYRSDAVIVGTYSLVNEELTLHARMIDHQTSRIISVASVSFPVADDPYTSDLLDISNGVVLPIRGIEGEND